MCFPLQLYARYVPVTYQTISSFPFESAHVYVTAIFFFVTCPLGTYQNIIICCRRNSGTVAPVVGNVTTTLGQDDIF